MVRQEWGRTCRNTEGRQPVVQVADAGATEVVIGKLIGGLMSKRRQINQVQYGLLAGYMLQGSFQYCAAGSQLPLPRAAIVSKCAGVAREGVYMPVLSLLRTGCILLVLSLIGCQAPEYRHRALPIVDEPNRHLSAILVVPLYFTSGGIAMGPDGKGLSTSDTPVVMAPFVFTSGDDILTNKVPARGLVLVPILTYVGEFKSVHRWLLLKKGYSPLVIDENVIWGERPTEMAPSAFDEVTPCIDLLLTAKPDQGALKTMMNAKGITGSIAVRLDAKDKALLRKYGSAPE